MYKRTGRKPTQLRKTTIKRRYLKDVAGSALIEVGKTKVLCAATFEAGVPKWRADSGLGWVTAEYDMLPASTSSRRPRNRYKIDGRTQEIQRLIGRSLRAVVDFEKLGENTIILDCDVIQADGGTRTAAITGAFVALADAIAYGRRKKLIAEDCLLDHIAAVSVGLIDNQVLLDLDYEEDSNVAVDLNLAMTGAGQIVELQATGEKATFSGEQLNKMIEYAGRGVRELIGVQKRVLGK